jgi:hypothetical protein
MTHKFTRLAYYFLSRFSYICYLISYLVIQIMKKTTAFSSLLLLGGLGSLSYLTAQLATLNLTFSLSGEEDHHYL